MSPAFSIQKPVFSREQKFSLSIADNCRSRPGSAGTAITRGKMNKVFWIMVFVVGFLMVLTLRLTAPDRGADTGAVHVIADRAANDLAVLARRSA